MYGLHIKITQAQLAKIYIYKNINNMSLEINATNMVQQNVQFQTINSQICPHQGAFVR